MLRRGIKVRYLLHDDLSTVSPPYATPGAKPLPGQPDRRAGPGCPAREG